MRSGDKCPLKDCGGTMYVRASRMCKSGRVEYLRCNDCQYRAKPRCTTAPDSRNESGTQ